MEGCGNEMRLDYAQETLAFFGRLEPSTASRGWDNHFRAEERLPEQGRMGSRRVMLANLYSIE